MRAMSGLVFTVFGSLLSIAVAQPSLEIIISSAVIYKEEKWTGNVECHFVQQYPHMDCGLSMHERGRRIDFNTSKSNENVFYFCDSTLDTSIILSISNMTYDYIQEYICLQDSTLQFGHTWLTTKPHIEFEGNQSVGNDVTLTCNSVPGAPLYWILPGVPQDNINVQILNTSNEVNSSTTAIIRMDDVSNNTEYKCCVRVKHGQNPIPCTSYILNIDEYPGHLIELVSYDFDFTASYERRMTCYLEVVNAYFTISSNVQWYYCYQESSCYPYSANSYTTSITHLNHSLLLNTTLTADDDPNMYSYECAYYYHIFHNFPYQKGPKSMDLQAMDKHVYYSNNGYVVTLSCLNTADSQPEIAWTQTNILSFANGSETLTTTGSYTIQTTTVSTTQWKTTLSIFPYDVTLHNSYYTCTASNALGQKSVRMHTIIGPDNLKIDLVSNEEVSNGTNAIRALCTFNTFPYPPNYVIDVITTQNIDVNTTLSYDEPHLFAAVTVDFQANLSISSVIVRCTAFNPFEVDYVIFEEMLVHQAAVSSTTMSSTTSTSTTMSSTTS